MAVLEEAKPDFVRDVEARQSNILFPDTLRNGLSVLYFLWNGSPRATLLQRVGLGLFSGIPLTYTVAISQIFSPWRYAEGTITGLIVGLIAGLTCTYATAKLLRNAFRRK